MGKRLHIQHSHPKVCEPQALAAMERNKQRQQCFSVWNCRTKQETKTIKQTDKETKNWNVLLQINVHSRVKDYIYGVWSSGVTMALLTVRKTD